ncbi:MAG: GrdX family protein [Clostridia bacterium]|nr:GrdX family protein [Clostridia bacterium]
MDFIIITNNPRVRDEYGAKYCVLYQECSFDEILYAVRDKIHKGHKLLTHPLSGSVKPNETPYKSIMISAERGAMDNDSVILIEDAINMATSGKFEKYRQRQATLNQRILADFQMIDFFLITSGIESAQTGLMV